MLLGIGNSPGVEILAWNIEFLEAYRFKEKIRGIYSEEPGIFQQDPKECVSTLLSAVDVIDACTNIKNIREHLQFQDMQGTQSGEEEADMCYALDAIIRDAEKKG